MNETSARRSIMKRLDVPLVARRTALILLAAIALSWVLTPGIRAFTLVANLSHRAMPPAARAGIPVQEVHFAAADGVRLAGWLALASPAAPTLILVHGFKSDRASMLPWARFLYAAGYNVLLYDSRGCGQSEGWRIALGAREPEDVIGAVRYLQARPDLKLKR